MGKAQDPRVVRTRRLLINALTELIVVEGYEAVTIRELVRKAEVNRSTFYLHFRDKQDIFNQMQNDILNELKETIQQPAYLYEQAINDFKNSNKPIKANIKFFLHIQKQASLYQKLLNESEFRQRFTKLMITEAHLFWDNIWEAVYMANGLVGIILYWLENGMKETVEEMNLLLTKAMLFPLAKFEE